MQDHEHYPTLKVFQVNWQINNHKSDYKIVEPQSTIKPTVEHHMDIVPPAKHNMALNPPAE